MTQAQPQRSTSDLVKAAVSGWLGTALEFMDFQLYSLGAALVFHEIFFPEQSAAMALIGDGHLRRRLHRAYCRGIYLRQNGRQNWP